MYFHAKFQRSLCIMSGPQITTMLKENKLTRQDPAGGENKP